MDLSSPKFSSNFHDLTRKNFENGFKIEQHCCIIERRQKLLKHIIDLQIPEFIQDITS